MAEYGGIPDPPRVALAKWRREFRQSPASAILGAVAHSVIWLALVGIPFTVMIVALLLGFEIISVR